MNKDAAETLAINAIAHIAGDEELLQGLIAQTGLGLDDLRAGKRIEPGPQTGRQTSAPAPGFISSTMRTSVVDSSRTSLIWGILRAPISSPIERTRTSFWTM